MDLGYRFRYKHRNAIINKCTSRFAEALHYPGKVTNELLYKRNILIHPVTRRVIRHFRPMNVSPFRIRDLHSDYIAGNAMWLYIHPLFQVRNFLAEKDYLLAEEFNVTLVS